MKQLVAILFIVSLFSCGKTTVVPNHPNTIGLSTFLIEDWDNWNFQIGDTTVNLQTENINEWDFWHYSSNAYYGYIKTSYVGVLGEWFLESNGFNIRIKRSYSGWGSWSIDDLNSDWSAIVKTSYPDNWDDWDIDFEEQHIDLKTVSLDDFDNWIGNGNFPNDCPLEFRIAVLFAPVITNVLFEQGIIH